MIKDEQTFGIIGAAQRVHASLGNGFLEKVYQDALEVEFQFSGIPYVREARIDVQYRGVVLGNPYFADFICHGDVIVELKALKRLSKIEEAQVLHYLRATGKSRALLLNFGASSLEVKRFVNGQLAMTDDGVC